MNTVKKSLVLAGLVTALGFSVGTLCGQPAGGVATGFGVQGGGGDAGGAAPDVRGEVTLTAIRQSLGVTDDVQWADIALKILAVQEARAALSPMGARASGTDRATGLPYGPFPTPAEVALQKAITAAEVDLQNAINANADPAVIKAKIAAVHSGRAARQKSLRDALDEAQNELRKVLTPRQEAILMNPITNPNGAAPIHPFLD